MTKKHKLLHVAMIHALKHIIVWCRSKRKNCSMLEKHFALAHRKFKWSDPHYGKILVQGAAGFTTRPLACAACTLSFEMPRKVSWMHTPLTLCPHGTSWCTKASRNPHTAGWAQLLEVVSKSAKRRAKRDTKQKKDEELSLAIYRCACLSFDMI